MRTIKLFSRTHGYAITRYPACESEQNYVVYTRHNRLEWTLILWIYTRDWILTRHIELGVAL